MTAESFIFVLALLFMSITITMLVVDRGERSKVRLWWEWRKRRPQPRHFMYGGGYVVWHKYQVALSKWRGHKP